MKVPYAWLKDYVDVRMDPQKLAQALTMAGINVTSFNKAGGDYIFECEITSNRPDCLSVLGIAREVAALLGKKLKIPSALTKKDARRNFAAADKRPAFKITIEDPALSPRYTARIITNVEVGPSCDWLKERIISVGLRPVNNIVDITNFVLFETGQPMHAFDLDRIKSGIRVRRAKMGEKIVTIDKLARTCSRDMLLIADEHGPIAIAGIMGGLQTEVNKMTKNILLESAFFDPVSIRKASRALALSSESSYRFERKVNNEMILKASNRAAALIEKIAGGKIGPLTDVGKKSSYSKTINFDPEKANRLLGVSIEKSRAAAILKTLGFSVKAQKSSLKVTVPGFREDVKTDVDITEELARIYGYEKIPLTIPRIIGNLRVKDFTAALKERIKAQLTRFGLDEIITYSLINRDAIKGLAIRDEEIVPIKNPLSIDQEIMRPTLLPGMLKVISRNLNRKAARLSIFELGKIYKEKKNSYIERPVVSIGLVGIKEKNWKTQTQEFTFFDIKGIFEKLLKELGLTLSFPPPCHSRTRFAGINSSGNPFEGNPHYFDEETSSVLEHNGEVIGYLGQVKRSICRQFDIEKKVFYGELYLEKILNKVKLDKKYTPLDRYPSINRDISILLDTGIPSSEVVHIVRENGSPLVREISLIDIYRGKQIPAGKQGLLYRIEYRSNEKTLKDAEVDHLHAKVKSALSSKLNLSFR